MTDFVDVNLGDTLPDDDPDAAIPAPEEGDEFEPLPWDDLDAGADDDDPTLGDEI